MERTFFSRNSLAIRSFVVLAAGLFLFTACGKTTQKVVLEGSFPAALKGDTLFLFTDQTDTLKIEDSRSLVNWVRDTIVLDSSGGFHLEKIIAEPDHYTLGRLIGGSLHPVKDFFLSEGLTKLESKDSALSDITVTGQSEQKIFETYEKLSVPIVKRFDSLSRVMQLWVLQQQLQGKMTAKNKLVFEQQVQEFQKQQQDLLEEMKRLHRTFIQQHKSSYVSAWLIGFYYKLGFFGNNEKELQSSIDLLDKRLQQANLITQIRWFQNKQAAKQALINGGGVAPDFTLPTLAGKDFTLSSLKGKIVVLDFWASWCGPCRKANPLLVRIYKKFKDKGVAFLSVSLDKKKQDWEEAVKKDGLTWEQVGDLKGWESKAAVLYDVSAIPATFLIDKEGKLLGRVEADNLEAKLNALIQK